MKLQHILEAKYQGDPRQDAWYSDAKTVADTNMNRAEDEMERDYWNEYSEFLDTNLKKLAFAWNEFKQDRDNYLERIRDNGTFEQRQVWAEQWGSNTSPHDFPWFSDYVHRTDRTPETLGVAIEDYWTYVTNTMLDILGSYRDAR